MKKSPDIKMSGRGPNIRMVGAMEMATPTF